MDVPAPVEGEEVSEIKDDIVDEAPVDAATATLEVEEGDTTGKESESDDASDNLAISTEGVEELASARDTTANVDEASESDDDESSGTCPDCGFLVFLREPSSVREHEYCSTPVWFCDICDTENMTVGEIEKHDRDKHKKVQKPAC